MHVVLWLIEVVIIDQVNFDVGLAMLKTIIVIIRVLREARGDAGVDTAEGIVHIHDVARDRGRRWMRPRVGHNR